jgi:hypothetical protein
MNTHQKFLEFNGKKIIFLSVDGTYWIALKPICEALNVSVRRCMDNVKKDPILGPERTIQYLQVENKGIIQGRKMTCIMIKWMNPSSFGKRLKNFCKYKGYHFNPNKKNIDEMDFIEFRKEFPSRLFFGEPDKSAGVEYITVGDDDYLIGF